MSQILISLVMLLLTTNYGSTPSIPESTASSVQSLETATISLSEKSNSADNAVAAQESELVLLLNDTPMTVQWEDNPSVSALLQLAKQEPLTIAMEPYGGFEQVGTLPQSITSNDEQMVTEPGDIVLYSGSSLVIFYSSNTWAYTKLGHIKGLSPEELTNVLNGNQITATLSVTENK